MEIFEPIEGARHNPFNSPIQLATESPRVSTTQYAGGTTGIQWIECHIIRLSTL